MTRPEEIPESDITCPVCGYYCIGKGGFGCIDKPWLVSEIERKRKEKDDGYPLDLDSWREGK